MEAGNRSAADSDCDAQFPCGCTHAQERQTVSGAMGNWTGCKPARSQGVLALLIPTQAKNIATIVGRSDYSRREKKGTR